MKKDQNVKSVNDNQPQKKKNKQKQSGFSLVTEGYKRALLLGNFIDAGRAPKMVDVEVAVCFADLRGFTNYVHRLQKDGQDNKVQHFLKAYFAIYPKAVLHGLWSLEPDDKDKEMTETEAELRKLLIPSTYKNLGDGMMIIWELQNASRAVIQGMATRFIIRITQTIEMMFKDLTTNLSAAELDAYSEHACDLRMGFGLSKGHAWRLDFGGVSRADYAGSIVNLAARLQGLARPSGIVAQLGFSQSKFEEDVKNKEGRIQTIKSPKGLGNEPIQVWTSNEVSLPTEILANVKPPSIQMAPPRFIHLPDKIPTKKISP